MKKIKCIVSIALVCVICLSLCACGIKEADAVGTWSGTYVYNGNTFAVAFVLSADGDYAKATYKNGSFSSTEDGTCLPQFEGFITYDELEPVGSDAISTYDYAISQGWQTSADLAS